MRPLSVLAALLSFLPLTAACVSVDPYSQRQTAVCNFQAEGADLYIRCSNGLWFVGSAEGGEALGQDGHGHELLADVILSEGRYVIADIEPAR